MSRNANPVTVGAFVVGTLLLAFLMLLFFSGGHWWSKRDRYVLIYDTSIKGLNIGAPVTIKGVKIGEVTDIKARMYGDSLSIFNTVTVDIDPKMLERDGERDGGELIDELIKRGLCAQLRLQSLLTGLLYVDVDFHPDKIAQIKKIPSPYKQIPTTPTDLEQLTRDLESIDVNKLGENLQQIVNGVNQFVNDSSLQNLVKNVEETLIAVRTSADAVKLQANRFGNAVIPLAEHGDQTVVELNRALPEMTVKLDQTLAALQQTAAALQQTSANTTYLTSEDSPLLYRIEAAAASVNGAAEQVRRLTDTLEHHPEALIYGKQEK
ncbi:MAG: paraquat-inducible protein [Verrucomicrobiaceae bacterium]|nr:paraquat-inducible protein [Verrucomicrobiaceae bacterium]